MWINIAIIIHITGHVKSIYSANIVNVSLRPRLTLWGDLYKYRETAKKVYMVSKVVPQLSYNQVKLL
jgi:hypothetical protein